MITFLQDGNYILFLAYKCAIETSAVYKLKNAMIREFSKKLAQTLIDYINVFLIDGKILFVDSINSNYFQPDNKEKIYKSTIPICQKEFQLLL